jgi:hypothetical protein
VSNKERSVNTIISMAGRQLHSKKASESVSSEEITQYGQACEFEDNSRPEFPESNKTLEQGELAGKVVAEKTSDVILDLGNKELETVSEDDVEIPLGQQVASSGENIKLALGQDPILTVHKFRENYCRLYGRL